MRYFCTVEFTRSSNGCEDCLNRARRGERVVGACRFTLQSAPQAIELPLGTAGRLSFVASVH